MKNKYYSIVIILFVSTTALQVQGQVTKSLQIEYVGNMGVAITKGDTTLLIDALHDYYEDGYLPSSPSFLKNLMGKKSPYKIVPAIMVTHKHNDHFDSALVRKTLDAHPESKLVSGSQLGSFLYNRHRKQLSLVDDVMTISIAPNIIIKTKKISHTYSQRHSGVQNTRFEIIWDDKKIIHIGDALSITESLEGLTDIDVLIIPYWHFLDKENVAHIEELNPGKVILTHISPKGSSKRYISRIVKPVEFKNYGDKVFISD